MGHSFAFSLLQDPSVVHIVVTIEVIPADRVGVVIIVIVFLLRFMEKIKYPVYHPPNGSGILADLLQCLDGFFIFW